MPIPSALPDASVPTMPEQHRCDGRSNLIKDKSLMTNRALLAKKKRG